MQPLERFRLDGGTQARLKIDEKVAAEYAEAMKSGAVFPPVIAFDDGNSLWLADGFHRHQACKLLGKTAIATDRRHGTQRDAILYSLGANASHGLQRSKEDKRKAVETMLNDESWRQWSGREIARRCGVSEAMVRKVRDGQYADETDDENSQRSFIHPGTGKQTVMNIANMRAKNKSGNPRRVKKRLSGIKTGLSKNTETAAREIFGVMGGNYCRALANSLGRILVTADAGKGASNE